MRLLALAWPLSFHAPTALESVRIPSWPRFPTFLPGSRVVPLGLLFVSATGLDTKKSELRLVIRRTGPWQKVSSLHERDDVEPISKDARRGRSVEHELVRLATTAQDRQPKPPPLGSVCHNLFLDT